jgi:hypothetical protein
MLLAVVCKSPGHAWNDADIFELLSFRYTCKSLLGGYPNAKHPSWISVISNPSGAKLLKLLHINKFEFEHHNIPLITLLRQIFTCSILLCTRMSGCQESLSLTFWTQITYQSFPFCWTMLHQEIFSTRFTNSHIGSSFKSYRLNHL